MGKTTRVSGAEATLNPPRDRLLCTIEAIGDRASLASHPPDPGERIDL